MNRSIAWVKEAKVCTLFLHPEIPCQEEKKMHRRCLNLEDCLMYTNLMGKNLISLGGKASTAP